MSAFAKDFARSWMSTDSHVDELDKLVTGGSSPRFAPMVDRRDHRSDSDCSELREDAGHLPDSPRRRRAPASTLHRGVLGGTALLGPSAAHIGTGLLRSESSHASITGVHGRLHRINIAMLTSLKWG